MKKTYAFAAIFVLLFVLSASLLPGITFANHVCIGDPNWDEDNDFAEGHACVPASNSGGGGKITTFEGLLGKLSSAVNSLVPFIIGLAVFVIIWGIFNYIVRAADEEKRADAKKYIIWGIVGLFFMLSIWGLVNILLNSINLDRTIKTSDIPRVPSIGGIDGTDGGTPSGRDNGRDGTDDCDPSIKDCQQ